VDFHLAAGREIAAQHAVPQTNIFGYTLPHAEWASHQWLGSLLIYAAWRLGELAGVGGAAGLTGAKCVVVLALVGFLYLATRREKWPGGRRVGRGPWDGAVIALVLALAAWAARPRLIERPLLLSALGEAILLWLLADYDSRRPKRLWWLVPLFVIWWNVHAGYIYGVLILGAFIAGDALERPRRGGAARLAKAGTLAILAGIVAARIVNPGSLRGLLFPIRMFRSPIFSSVIEEFGHTTPRTDPAFDALVVLTLAAVALATVRGRRPRAAHLLLLAGFGALAMLRLRMILDDSVIAAPIVAGTLASLAPAGNAARPARWLTAGRADAAAAILLLAIVPWRVARGEPLHFGCGLDARVRPFGAYDFIAREHLPGEVMVTDLWSGSFLWRFYPARRVFVHNQLEVYDENFARNIYLPLLRAEEGWQAMLARAGVNVLVLRHSGARFDQRLEAAAFADPGWVLVYWDDIALIFVSNTGANARLIASHAFRGVNPDAPDLAGVIASGRAGEAESELRRVVADNPGTCRAWNILGDLFLDEGRVDEAAAAFAEIDHRAAYDEERALGLEGRARAALAEGRAADALTFATEALHLAAHDPDARAIHAMSLFAAGKRDRAEAESADIARSGGAATEDLVSLAQAAIAAGDRDVAASLTESAARGIANPADRARLYLAMGATWENGGAPAAAEDCYRRAVALDSSNVDAMKSLAWLVGKSGRNAEALSLAHRAAELAPADGAAWGTLGFALLSAERADSAIICFERSRDLLAGAAGVEPRNRGALAQTLVGLAMACDGAGRHAERETALDAAAALNPGPAIESEIARLRSQGAAPENAVPDSRRQ